MRIRYTTNSSGRLVKKALVYTEHEHKISNDDIDSDALRIIERLKQNRHDAYIVGGAVRDLMIGKKPKDFDIVTDATPTRIKRLFRNARIIGRRFRLVHIFFGPKIYEVATFRSLVEGTAGNTFGTIEEDVRRRDFSLNALFYDPTEKTVIDYVGGVKDIQKKRVLPVIPMDIIFQDDPVRMLRAVKYAATTGFRIPFFLSRRIAKEHHLLATISPSRLTEEWFKIINSAKSACIVAAMQKSGLYAWLQPEASRMMQNDALYQSKYFDSLEALDSVHTSCAEREPGLLLSFMIRDYLDTIVDWLEEDGKGFPSVFTLCRAWVLPINPPRVELENALRLLFRQHGVQVRRSRRTPRQGLALDETIAPLEGEVPKKRRRRRRKKSAGQRTFEQTESPLE